MRQEVPREKLIQEALKINKDFFEDSENVELDIVFLTSEEEVVEFGLPAPEGEIGAGCQQKSLDGRVLIFFQDAELYSELFRGERTLDEYQGHFIHEVGHGFHAFSYPADTPWWFAEAIANHACGFNYEDRFSYVDFRQTMEVVSFEGVSAEQISDSFTSSYRFIESLVKEHGKGKLFDFMRSLTESFNKGRESVF